MAIFVKYLDILRRKAFEEFAMGRDMILGTCIATHNLGLLVHYKLIEPKDWQEHKRLWVLCTVVPYAIVLGAHAIFRILVSPSIIYDEQQNKLVIAEKMRAEAEARLHQGKPLFVFDVVAQPNWKNPTPIGGQIFKLTNCGSRPARWVRLETLASKQGKHKLHFVEIPLLPAGDAAPVGYSVNSAGGMDQRWLWEFLTDNPRDAAVVWWDIQIKFRDTDESGSEDIARLCFDIETGCLFVRAVPYTERGFQPSLQGGLVVRPSS